MGGLSPHTESEGVIGSLIAQGSRLPLSKMAVKYLRSNRPWAPFLHSPLHSLAPVPVFEKDDIDVPPDRYILGDHTCALAVVYDNLYTTSSYMHN